MTRSFTAAALIVFATACSARDSGGHQAAVTQEAAVLPAQAAVKPAPVTLTAADRVKVYGDYYAAAHPRALILLFHQAGSSAAEYATIAPRLVGLGYSALAIDERSGGDMFAPNRTVRALGGSKDYAAAAQDLRAALAFAGGSGLRVIVWGSSYSAALAFPLAAQNPGKVRALLAFSPGEYLDDKQAVHAAAAQLAIPVFLDAGNAKEAVAARSIAAAAASAPDRTVFVPRHGVHGSSTLIPARDPDGAAENWTAVERFLASLRLG